MARERARGDQFDQPRHSDEGWSRRRRYPEIFDVAWIQLDRAFKVPQSLRPTALTPVRQCGLIVNRRIVRQSAPRKLQLSARPIVLAQAPGQIAGPDKMHFTGIGLDWAAFSIIAFAA